MNSEYDILFMTMKVIIMHCSFRATLIAVRKKVKLIVNIELKSRVSNSLSFPFVNK